MEVKKENDQINNVPVFIQTLKKMYSDKKIDVVKIKNYYTRKIITLQEYEWILDK